MLSVQWQPKDYVFNKDLANLTAEYPIYNVKRIAMLRIIHSSQVLELVKLKTRWVKMMSGMTEWSILK